MVLMLNEAQKKYLLLLNKRSTYSRLSSQTFSDFIQFHFNFGTLKYTKYNEIQLFLVLIGDKWVIEKQDIFLKNETNAL